VWRGEEGQKHPPPPPPHDALRRGLGVGDGPFQLSARAWAVAGTVAVD
jgi:hypothetical protein